MIVELLMCHKLICVSACWILFEAEMYLLVEFHLTSLYFSCLALEVFFWHSDVLLFLAICDCDY